MAKDGTNRGGARWGTGPKSKKQTPIPKIEPLEDSYEMKLPESEDLGDFYEDIPKVSPYLFEEQHKNYTELTAKDIFAKTYMWLKRIGCEEMVSQQLIEQYAMGVARWIQCERALSKHGLLAPHPTTGNPMISPFVKMSREYKKQMNADWYQIYIIARNSGFDSDEYDPMEDLLD